MKPYRAGVLAFLTVASIPGVAGSSASHDSPWSRKMQDLYSSMSEALVDVSSDERFNSPSGQARLKKNAKTIADLAHSLGKKNVKSPDADPSVNLFAGIFADEAKTAYESLSHGYKPYAREILRSLPGYCIACHTRTQLGPSFDSLPVTKGFDALPLLSKGEFYAATRQYDLALKSFDQVISSDALAKSQPFEWTSAVRQALAIAVRVKDDPTLSLKIIDQVIATQSAPFYIRQDAEAWKLSVSLWKSDAPREIKSEEGLYSEAVRLLALAHEGQKYPADHSADILYLRASAAVHRLLQLGLDGRYANQGLLMAGMCYDVLRSFKIGEIHEIYFEACVRKSPHTEIAESCYRRYEQAVYEGFTGSSGTHLPSDVREKLKSLENLSKQESRKQNP